MIAIGRFCILLGILCCLGSPGQAQTLSREEVSNAVVKISDLIRRNYVFEERGNRIAAHLTEEDKKGTFHAVKNWSEFATLCTRTLQTYSHDGHLYVRCDAKTVKELSTSSGPVVESGGEDAFFHSKEARERNFGFEEVKVLSGNIGYLKLSEINVSAKSLPTLFASVEFIARTKALILDLRNNGGGGSEIGAVLESMFLPKKATLLEFRTRTGLSTTAETVPWLTQKKYENPLFILINKGTASAAEAFTFALQANKRATVVGQRSSGAAHMNSWYVVNDSLYVSVSTGAPTLPGTERSWEGRGIQPDYSVAEGEEIKFVLRKISEK